jgi:hypothetical protein
MASLNNHSEVSISNYSIFIWPPQMPINTKNVALLNTKAKSCRTETRSTNI